MALLKDDAWAILKELRYLRPSNSPERHKAVEREAEKKAIETARYVIPIAAFTSMVHTVSGLVLHRLHRMLSAGDTPHEARLVIGAMVDLFAAETGNLIAWVHYLLGDRLDAVSPVVRQRMAQEVERRILAPKSEAARQEMSSAFDSLMQARSISAANVARDDRATTQRCSTSSRS